MMMMIKDLTRKVREGGRSYIDLRTFFGLGQSREKFRVDRGCLEVLLYIWGGCRCGVVQVPRALCGEPAAAPLPLLLYTPHDSPLGCKKSEPHRHAHPPHTPGGRGCKMCWVSLFFFFCSFFPVCIFCLSRFCYPALLGERPSLLRSAFLIAGI